MESIKKAILLTILLLLPIITYSKTNSLSDNLKSMFNEVVVKKNANLISDYYDKEFLLFTNGKQMDYLQFYSSHKKIYQTNIKYSIRFDEQSFVEQGNKVAARVFITTQKDNDSAKPIEVILIAQYKKDKLYRLWEITYPDWSKMKSFKDM
ncbi:MAG: hypothetical protein EPN84_12495 [Legionella sp.]|nr:MAG: hypothetical protein EPN84_12495 [Legionella sp.]